MEPFRVYARNGRSIGGICVTCDLAIWLWEWEARTVLTSYLTVAADRSRF
jgi:hypothetical protein